MSIETKLRDLADEIEIRKAAAETRGREIIAAARGYLRIWWKPFVAGVAVGIAVAALIVG
jgi:hypothetical protein